MAYTFTGSGAFFISSNNTTLSNIKPLSISVWLFVTSQGGAEAGVNGSGRIYHKAGSANTTVGGPEFATNPVTNSSGDYAFNFYTTITNLSVETSAGNIAIQRWQNSVMTWDGTLTATGCKIYIAGTEPAIYAIRQNGLGVLDDDSVNDLYIGNRQLFARALTCGMCELAVWNAVLTPDEVMMLSQSRTARIPLQIQPSKLVMYFPMDEVSEGISSSAATNTIFDMSSNKIIGISTNGTGGTAPKGLAQAALSYP